METVTCRQITKRLMGYGVCYPGTIRPGEVIAAHLVALKNNDGWIELTLDDKTEAFSPFFTPTLVAPTRPTLRTNVELWQQITGRSEERPASRWNRSSRRWGWKGPEPYHVCVMCEWEGVPVVWRVIGIRAWGLFPLKLDTIHLQLVPTRRRSLPGPL